MFKKKSAPSRGSDLLPCCPSCLKTPCRTSRKTSKHNLPSLCLLIRKEKARKSFQYVFPLAPRYGLINWSQLICSCGKYSMCTVHPHCVTNTFHGQVRTSDNFVCKEYPSMKKLISGVHHILAPTQCMRQIIVLLEEPTRSSCP